MKTNLKRMTVKPIMKLLTLFQEISQRRLITKPQGKFRLNRNNEKLKAKSNQKGYQFQILPISSHNQMSGVQYQEGMSISHITNKPINYLNKRINARQNMTNANLSMLNNESPGFLNEIKIRESNDTVAPNITIYQNFKVSLGDSKGRTNRFKINQSVGINEIINNRKQSVRESFESKKSMKQKIISSVDSETVNGKPRIQQIHTLIVTS